MYPDNYRPNDYRVPRSMREAFQDDQPLSVDDDQAPEYWTWFLAGWAAFVFIWVGWGWL
jgi:hypothetical protein